MNNFKKVLFLVLILVIGSLGGIIGNRYIFPYLSTTAFFSKFNFIKQANKEVTIINRTEEVYIKEDTSVSKITNQAISSVVSIVSYSTVAEKPIARNNLLKNKPEISRVATKNGVGMIVTSDGFILSYKDAIIAENAKYKVVMSDENVVDAELVGIDSYSNLVFFKINSGNLPAASFVNPEELKAGEKIIAIGNNSETYDPMFSVGILSGYNEEYNLSDKNISSSEKLSGVFDISHAGGGSYIGGPVIDYAGQVVGIMGIVDKGNGGEYFVIPSDKIKSVIDKAVKKSFVNNSALGVYFVPITKIYASIHQLPTEQGAQIYSQSGQQGLAIIANSPAANGGLRLNDIITAVSGEKIEATKSLSELLYKYQKGDELQLTVKRNAEELTLKIQL